MNDNGEASQSVQRAGDGTGWWTTERAQLKRVTAGSSVPAAAFQAGLRRSRVTPGSWRSASSAVPRNVTGTASKIILDAL